MLVSMRGRRLASHFFVLLVDRHRSAYARRSRARLSVHFGHDYGQRSDAVWQGSPEYVSESEA